MNPIYFTIAGFCLVGIVLFLPFFTCSRRARAEINLTPLWQKRCAGKMGVIGLLAIRVALYEDFMVIAFFGQTVIPYRDIAEVSAKRSFWSLNFSGVVLKLRDLSSGYRFNLNLRDSTEFVKIIESHLPHHPAK